jgi:hypothetical protein
MKISKTRQCEINELSDYRFDLFMTASGYETRARFLVETQNAKIISQRRVCIGFSNHRELLSRTINDQTFLHSNFENLIFSGDDEFFISELLSSLFKEQKKEVINILIDYSSMTRIWYGAILKYFKYSCQHEKGVNLFFSYSTSQFDKPSIVNVYNRHVGPIDGFYSISIPNKPTALIIGLGYTQSRAYGLSEFFDVDPFVFIADPSSDESFYNEVMQNNSSLINSLNDDQIFRYPLNNLLMTETLLFSLSKDLLSDYRVVLAPCGPKPFTLLCLVTGLRLPNVDVWRISAGEDDVPIEKIPSGYFNILKVSLI